MPHNTTSNSDNPRAAVKLPVNDHNETDSAATEDSYLNNTANGSSKNDPILRDNDRIHATRPPVLTSGIRRVIPPWLDDFEFYYNNLNWFLPENKILLTEKDGKPVCARLTLRGACKLYDVLPAQAVLRRCNPEKVTEFSWEERALNCVEPEKAILELRNRVYVGSTVLLLRVLEEVTLGSGVN